MMKKDIIMTAFFENNSLSLLTEIIGKELNCPIIITDSTFHIVTTYCKEDMRTESYRNAVAHSALSLKMCSEIKSMSAESDGRIFANDVIHIARKLSCGGAEIGCALYSFLNENDIPKETDLEFCEGLLSKQLYLESHCTGEVLSTADEIITDLLDGKFETEEILRLQISGTYLAHLSPSRFAYIRPSEKTAGCCPDIESVLRHRLSGDFHSAHPLAYDNGIIIFLHENRDIRCLDNLTDEFCMTTVISAELKSLYDMKYEFPTMKKIAEYILSNEENRYRAVFESDYSWGVLFSEIGGRNGFINRKIKKMHDFDVKNGSELCRTLYTYLTCCHSLQKTSERLFTHSNTIAYRLQKIRDEFEIRTDIPEQHFAHLLSLTAVLHDSDNLDEYKISEE